MTSDRIASLTGVPTDYSVEVLQMLARAGLVKAQRGRGGGFRIECDPDTTTLLDVINAIDPLERQPPFQAKNSPGIRRVALADRASADSSLNMPGCWPVGRLTAPH